MDVIFGAGHVGTPLAAKLLKDGMRVRVVKRTRADAHGAELYLGDAADQQFCIGAAKGAAVVYHCIYPPYNTDIWAEYVPRYMGNLIVAAGTAGARLVVLDNLYMLGQTGGRPIIYIISRQQATQNAIHEEPWPSLEPHSFFY